MEGFANDVGADAILEAAKGILQEIIRHVRYVIFYKKNVDEFKKKLGVLKAKRESVQLQVDDAESKNKKIKPDVELWCETVDKVIDEDVKEMEDLEDKAQNSWTSRYQLSKKAEQGVADVDDLIQQSCQFNGVACGDVREPPKCAPPKNFEAFDSRKEVFDGVIEALKDSTIAVIGVCGTGGVGKTTLVNQVAGEVQEDNLFDWVVKATATHTPNIHKIQDEIADFLRLRLEGTTIPMRALSLSQRLKKEKKILVILDDIWGRLDLEEVGIPFGDQHKGCKILLTSRNRDVLTNEMDAKKAFSIDVLEETEAWNLFKETVENDFKDSELRSVAIEVAKKCEGLPVAIVTVARALRSKELFEWEDALAQLQRPSPSDLQTGIPAAVYSAIELSYNNLKSEQLKKTFLLCGLLGHNARVEDLVRYTMGLSLFENVNTVEGTRNRVLTLVSKLKAFCLLRDSYSDDRFDMHDFDCDVALAIASRDNHAFVLKHKGVFYDWPDEEQLRNFQMISLSFDSVEKFPHQLECPRLDFFCMGSKDSDVEMPASFFQKMENLKVLDLIEIEVSSISLPASLRTLCLNRCVLGDMVNLGKLKNLEILNLSGSDIEMLPEEAGQLTKLRLLDVSRCFNLKIPAGVLSSLSKLEELYMDCSLHHWNEGSNARLDELRDLPCLTTLNARIPDAKFVPYELFSLFAEKLKRYSIVIGRVSYWNTASSTAEIEKFSRALLLSVNTSIHQLDDRVQCLLMKSTAFYLGGLKGAKIVFSEVGNREGLLHLKHIHIRSCPEIQYIMQGLKIEFQQLQCLTLAELPQLISFCSKDRSGGSTSTSQHDRTLFGEEVKFPCLEKLELYSLDVEKIWPNKFSIIFFDLQNLTSLTIERCHNLKHIVSYSVARSLRHLKSFAIKYCKCLREIIFVETIEEDTMDQIFPELEFLELQYLPDLTRFCHECNLELPLLKELIMEDCFTFKTFISKATMTNEIHIIQETEENNSENNVLYIFNEKMKFPCLENLVLDSLNVEKIWPNEISIIFDYFQNLTSLSIYDCDNLKHILSFSMTRSLWHLKSFAINRCKCLREIIFAEDIEEDMRCLIFPKLEFLELKNLPKLMRFWRGSYLEFTVLKELIIDNCLAFETFISDSTMANKIHICQEAEENNLEINVSSLFNEKMKFPCLEKLELHLLNVEKIWPNEISIISDYFQNLISLSIHYCDNLKHILSFSVARSLRHLKSFEIKGCGCLREIIFVENIEEDTVDQIFPELELLKLQDIPNLMRFCHGSNLELPLLKELIMGDCFHFETFISDSTMANKNHICREAEENNLEINVSSLFNEKVAFPSLERLSLFRMGNCRKIWHDQLTSDSFCNLNNLQVDQCNRLLTIFPFSISARLQNLEKLKITECESLEEIFEHEVLNANNLHAVAATQSIVEEKTTNFVFPKLIDLEFYMLPRLRSFYSRIHTLEWPSLKGMKVCGCDKVEILVSENLLSFGESTS